VKHHNGDITDGDITADIDRDDSSNEATHNESHHSEHGADQQSGTDQSIGEHGASEQPVDEHSFDESSSNEHASNEHASNQYLGTEAISVEQPTAETVVDVHENSEPATDERAAAEGTSDTHPANTHDGADGFAADGVAVENVAVDQAVTDHAAHDGNAAHDNAAHDNAAHDNNVANAEHSITDAAAAETVSDGETGAAEAELEHQSEPEPAEPEQIEPEQVAAEHVEGEQSGTEQIAAEQSAPEQIEAEHPAEPERVEPAAAAPLGSTFDDSTPLARELAEITRRRVAIEAAALPMPDKPRIFTIANQKGGVGKTTTTVNLAAALARAGANVLVIDLDPQGNASTALGVEHRADTISVYDVIINDEPMSQVVQKSPEFDGLYCVPATIHLAGAEIELVSLVAREQRLHTALDRFLGEADEEFHYVFIDCPPSLGLLTINAFVAAREVLIPIQCEYYALEGLSQLLSNIKLIEKHLNPKLSVSTILLTMYDSRTNLANQVADEVREHFPKEVLNTLIPRSVRISEAPSYGQSVISYDPTSPGSLSYLEAASEIAHRGAPS